MPAMKDAPIITTGTIIERRDERTFYVRLKNGKRILGHTQLKLAHIRDELKDGYTVTLEMTPFDFEKGRIVEYSVS